MTTFPRRVGVFLIVAVFVAGAIGGVVAACFVALSATRDAVMYGVVAFGSSLAGSIFLAWLLWKWTARRIDAIRRMTDALKEIVSGEKRSLPSLGSSDDLGEISVRLRSVAESAIRQRSALLERKEELTEILNAMGEGLLAINQAGEILLANDRVVDLFDVRQPLLGKRYLEVIRNSAVASAFDRALSGGASTERASVIVKGLDRRIEIRVFPLARSPEIAAVALFIDVTQIHHLERVRRDFLADFSHEVRTPLTALRSAIDTLESEDTAPDQERRLRNIIARHVARLGRLVQDLAELNSIESGELILQKEPISMLRLVGDLVHDFLEEAGSQQISIIVDGEEVRAQVDPVRVSQIVSNLIDNAIKHAAGCSEIRIDVEDGGEHAVVTVRDNGEGIPPEEQERIFNRLYRVDKSRSRESAGSGLGLAIAKHLVLMHGGSISVRSGKGRGTEFRVSFPKSAS